MNTTKSNTPAIDKAMFDKLLAVPAIQAAFAEVTAGEEAATAAARKAALDEKAQIDRELAELASQDDSIGVSVAQLEDELADLRRQRYTISIAIQRGKVRHRQIEVALRDEHGGRLITHVVNYLKNTAGTAEREADCQATLKAPAGRNFLGDTVMKADPKALAKAVELRDAAIGLRETADTIEALALEAVSPQEIRRRIQAKLEAIGLTLYQGKLPEHMVSRLVHAQGEGQARAVELLAPKIAA